MRISDWSQTCALPICSLSKQRANFDGGFGALYGVDRPTVPAYEVIDLRAGLDFGRYSVELFAKNLGNSHGITDVATGGGLPVAPGGAIPAGIIQIGRASCRERVGQYV